MTSTRPAHRRTVRRAATAIVTAQAVLVRAVLAIRTVAAVLAARPRRPAAIAVISQAIVKRQQHKAAAAHRIISSLQTPIPISNLHPHPVIVRVRRTIVDLQIRQRLLPAAATINSKALVTASPVQVQHLTTSPGRTISKDRQIHITNRPTIITILSKDHLAPAVNIIATTTTTNKTITRVPQIPVHRTQIRTITTAIKRKNRQTTTKVPDQIRAKVHREQLTQTIIKNGLIQTTTKDPNQTKITITKVLQANRILVMPTIHQDPTTSQPVPVEFALTMVSWETIEIAANSIDV